MPYHLAQINIGTVKGPMDSEIMYGFASRLDELMRLPTEHQGLSGVCKRAKDRLMYLDRHGPTPLAFTFKQRFSVNDLPAHTA